MNFEDVMSLQEAAEKWNVAQVTLRQSCIGYKGKPPRFKESEARKSGGTWLVTRAGMERLYGKQEDRQK